MLLALILALVAPPGSVELDGERYRELTRPRVEAPAPAPWAERREVTIEPAQGGLRVRARWQIRALGTGWFSGQLFGATPGLRVIDARWNGQPAALKVDAAGGVIAGKVTGDAAATLELFVPGDPAQAAVALQLLPAVRGKIEARAPEGLAPALAVDGAPPLPVFGGFAGGGRELLLSFGTPPAPAADRPAMIVARVGIGLTVGDADLRGRARAVWEVRQGELAEVTLATAGLGADLEVTGPNVRRWAREGERIKVELQSPARDRIEVELRWTIPIGRAGETKAPVPTITPEGVFRSEAALQLARDGEVEAVPETPTWSAVAAASLPAWAQGLVEGTATASLRGGPGGTLSLLRFVPLEGPPVVVDVAAYTVATSREGRALIRAHYEVRNERAAHLRLRPPEGFKVIGVRVGGKATTPARATDGAWIVPLLRSVETVSGLLSFPIEVILLGESRPWKRREQRSLELPRVDAPVAVSRLTLHLPPGYKSRLDPGEGDVVAAFTRGEGITYGLGVGEVGAAQADAIFQDAVQAWMSNDFGAAQQKLDELKAMGAKNENIDRLQGNLYVVSGKGEGSQDVALSRRIREQAKARSVRDKQVQVELKKKAEEERARGDYDAAASSYKQALEVGGKLAQLEQAESVEEKETNVALAREIAVVTKSSMDQKVTRQKKGRRKSFAKGGGGGGGAKPTAASGTVYDFEDDTVDGVMLTPDGAKRPEEPAGGVEDADGKRLPPAKRPEPAYAPDVDGDTVADKLDALDEGAPPPEAVVDVTTTSESALATGSTAPDASRDATGIQLGSATGTENHYFADGQSVKPPAPAPGPVAGEPLVLETSAHRTFQSVVQSVPGVFARGRARRAGRYRNASTADTTTPPPPPADAANVANSIPAGMPTPVVHATALTVVVPQVGEAVRYQRLLLPPDAAYSVEIAAKEPLFAKE